MKKILIFIFILSSLASYSQEEDENFKFGIGGAAGFSTGYGLSFRYWPSDWGIQVTTAPYYMKDDAQISFGLTTLKTIKDDGRIKLFAYWGNHLLYERWAYYYGYPDDREVNTETTWITGLGPGFEFTIARKVSFNIMFGVAAYMNGNFMLNMTGETGLFYKF